MGQVWGESDISDPFTPILRPLQYYRTLALLRPLRCYAPPPLQREVTAKGHFLLPYTPPHLHMHTCALTSMFTLVLRCYYVVIFAKCVRLFARSLAEGCVRVVQDYDSDTAA